MIKFIEYKSTLMFYDGPELIEAEDRIGGNYIGMALDRDRTAFKFLVVSVTPSVLYQLRHGEIDLRSVVLESAKDGWYVCETDSLEEQISIQNQGDDLIPDTLLPDEDYFVGDTIDHKEVVMLEATARRNFVLLLQIEPKNYHQIHRLNCKDYGDLITGLHFLIISAWRSDSTPTTAVERSKSDLYVVTPAEKGSIRVLFEASKADEDIVDPHRLLVRALEQIDLAISNTDDAEKVRKLSLELGVEFAKKFMKFMQVLHRSKVDLRYSWAEPRLQTGNSNRIRLSTVQKLVSSIENESHKVVKETVRSVHGKFVRFARQSGKWGLDTENGLVEGVVDAKERPNKLDGLEVGAHYTFECIERLTFVQVWTNTNPTLILRTIREN